MAFKNTNLSVLAYNTGYILRRNALISRILSQSSGTRFTPGNGYTYEIFINPGTFTVHTGGYVDMMLIGGGGGGGSGGEGTSAYGGGGGAGGMLTQYNTLLPQGIYTVTIGGGGAGGAFVTISPPIAPEYIRGQDGQTTTISSPTITTITATGGGGGGGGHLPPAPGVQYPNLDGRPGGSGGGAGGGTTAYDDFGNGTPGQGYPGGLGEPNAGSPGYSGGGGGGASLAGDTFPPGAGGAGASAFSGDSGIPSDYGMIGPDGLRYFAGGGRGGNSPSSIRPLGGGGIPGSSGAGLTNTGSGGAGGNTNGYNGGPGIVIVRYLTNAP